MTDVTKRSAGGWFKETYSMEPDNSDIDETNLLKKQAQEYSGETSIHGLKYIGEKDRTTCER